MQLFRRILVGALMGGAVGLALGLLLRPLIGNHLVFAVLFGAIVVGLDRALGGEPTGPARSVSDAIMRALGGEVSLPSHWSEIRHFVVLVHLKTPDLSRAEAGIRKAVQIRAALVELCQDRYFPNEIYRVIQVKQRAGKDLSTEEAKYAAQADSNYLEYACEKISIFLFYEDYYASSLAERNALCQLADRYQGCALVSRPGGLPDCFIYRLSPEGLLTREQARKILRKILTKNLGS
jgi:hypothetical protein